MKEMLIAQGITILIMILGFIGNILYFKGNFTARIENTEEDIANLKKSVQYKDTCDSISCGLDTRIASLETVRNSKK